MSVCTEDEALAYLQNAFSSHFGAGTRVANINDRLDAYTAQYTRRIQQSPSPESETLIPDSLTGLPRRYLEAVRKNAIAKKRYEAAVRSIWQRSMPAEGRGPTNSAPHDLSAHLELLREQRRYEKLGVVEKFLFELNQLDDELQTNAATREPRDQPVPAHQSCGNDTAANVSPLRDLMNKLEIAVVRSAGDAQREKAQLAAARAGANTTHNSDPVREAQALIAVRDELTQWLEQNLALCAEGEEEEFQEAIGDNETIRITQEEIENQYEEYIVARQRLLDAAARLKLPLEAGGESSPVEVEKPMATQIPPPDEAFDAEAQQQQRQLNQNMKYVKKYLAEELGKEKQESLEGLLRLVDESQLLPQYPVLAKDERFGKIVGSLGGQSEPNVDDKITEQIEAWSFAADAADKTLEATLGTHVSRATRALDEVDEMLRDLKILKEHAGG